MESRKTLTPHHIKQGSGADVAAYSNAGGDSHSRFPLPSINPNGQSLHNKVNELQAHVRFQHEFRNTCLLVFTETCLSDRLSNAELSIDGFVEPVRLDRDPGVTGKSQGGGVCLYVNERWCKTVLIREWLCTKHIKLLAVSLHPHYLPPIICHHYVYPPKSQRGGSLRVYTKGEPEAAVPISWCPHLCSWWF